MNEDALRALVRETLARLESRAADVPSVPQPPDPGRLLAVHVGPQPLPVRAAALGRPVPDRAGRAVQPLRLLPVARSLTKPASRSRIQIAMARVLLTRSIPSSVLGLLEAEHTVDLYSGEGAIPRAELLTPRRRQGRAHLRADRPDRRRGHGAAPALKVDRQHRGRLRQHRRAGRAQARHRRHEHAGRADRGHRRVHLGADSRHHPPRRRRRSADPRRRLEPLGTRLHARHGAARQAARHHRRRPHRPGRGGQGAGVRHEDGLRRPAEQVATSQGRDRSHSTSCS